MVTNFWDDWLAGYLDAHAGQIIILLKPMFSLIVAYVYFLLVQAPRRDRSFGFTMQHDRFFRGRKEMSLTMLIGGGSSLAAQIVEVALVLLVWLSTAAALANDLSTVYRRTSTKMFDKFVN